MRYEHRTLPVLIALGVLLGAGLAVATPAGHHANGPGPTPPGHRSTSPSPSGGVSSTASPTPVDDSPGGRPACANPAPIPGWATGHQPLAHAVRVVAATCGDANAGGLDVAIRHLGDAAGGRTGGHGPTGRRGGPDGSNPGRGAGRGGPANAGGGSNGGADGATGGGAAGASTGSGGSDTIHGNGNDGQHGNDLKSADPAKGPGRSPSPAHDGANGHAANARPTSVPPSRPV